MGASVITSLPPSMVPLIDLPSFDECYYVPDGYLDEHFLYGFDGNTLTDGSSPLNLAVQMQGGYDFILRRIVGADSLVSATGTFRYQYESGNYESSAPVVVRDNVFQDFGVVPELLYTETSQIAFDLGDVLRRVNAGVFSSQVVFQGVRRRKGVEKPPAFRYKPRPYWITTSVNVNWLATDVNPTRATLLNLDSYDFDLYAISIRDPGGTAAPTAKMTLFNAAQYRLSNIPIVLSYISEPLPWGRVNATGYLSGAIVPPIHYFSESQIRFELTSLLAAGSQTVEFVFWGMQRYPC